METLLAKDMPKELYAECMRTLESYSVGFAEVRKEGQVVTANLLGSGTLVQVGEKRAILTAHHVLQVLRNSERLGLLLDRHGPTSAPYTVDKAGLYFLEIDRGKVDADGPDLGAVILATNIASSLEAKKSFYNLNSHRDEILNRPLDLKFGIWVVQGFLNERTTTKVEDDRILVTQFFNYSGYSQPDEIVIRDGYDYFDFPVSVQGRSEAPINWGGMSGSGLWQIPLKRQGDTIVRQSIPLLSGVVFYQNPTTHTTCGVKAHGRRSVYEKAYDSMLNPTP